MKLPICLMGLALAWLPALLLAQEADPTEIPTEVSEPPYAVGDLVTKSGLYFDRGEALPQVNLRIVDNKWRLYWIDENGLIAEPESGEANIRLRGSVRGHSYFYLEPLPEGSGLGADALVLQPRIFNGVLTLAASNPDGAEAVYPFRYTQALDTETDPEIVQ